MGVNDVTIRRAEGEIDIASSKTNQYGFLKANMNRGYDVKWRAGKTQTDRHLPETVTAKDVQFLQLNKYEKRWKNTYTHKDRAEYENGENEFTASTKFEERENAKSKKSGIQQTESPFFLFFFSFRCRHCKHAFAKCLW